MRPMFHFTEKRIEAHICICFVAYKIDKELGRTMRMKNIAMSVDKVLEIAKTSPADLLATFEKVKVFLICYIWKLEIPL